MPKTATYPEPWRPGAATATSATAGCEQGAQHNRCKRRMCLNPTNLVGSGSYLHGIWHACVPSFSINCDVVETSGWSYQLTRNRGTKGDTGVRARPTGAVASAQPPGTGRIGMISTESPGKIAKCGWFWNILAAASCDSARTTVKAAS